MNVTEKIALLSLACGLRDGSITCEALDTDLEVDALADPSGPDCYPATMIEFRRGEEVVASVGCWKLGQYHHGPNRRDNGQYIGPGWSWQQDDGDGQTSGRPRSRLNKADTVTWQESAGSQLALTLELPTREEDDDEVDNVSVMIQEIQDAIDGAYEEITVTPADDKAVRLALVYLFSYYSVQHEIGNVTHEIAIHAGHDAGRPVFTHAGTDKIWTDAHECIKSARAYQVQQLREAADEIEAYDYGEVDAKMAARMLVDATPN